MTITLTRKYEVIYYLDGERKVFWPADTSSRILTDALNMARGLGYSARLSEVTT